MLSPLNSCSLAIRDWSLHCDRCPLSKPTHLLDIETLSSSTYQFHAKDIVVGAQMLFIAFGALVLVPILTGLNPNVALFTAGLGALLFQVVTGGHHQCQRPAPFHRKRAGILIYMNPV